jgi:hypothetical protein
MTLGKNMSLLPRTERERMPILAFALLVMGLFWFCSWWWLLWRLRTRHPVFYESIGSPTLGPAHGTVMTWFLFSRRWRQLPDPLLVSVCWLMLVFSLSAPLLFVGLAALLFWDVPSH